MHSKLLNRLCLTVFIMNSLQFAQDTEEGLVMSTSELERRLGELLQRHAEDAMNGTNTEEELERLQDDTGRSARRRRRAWVAGGLVAVAAATVVVVWRPDVGNHQAAPDPAAQEQRAEQTATAFVEAFAAFDPDRAATYLADGPSLAIWTDELGNDHWRRGNRLMQAFGTQILLDECKALWSAGPATYVSCVFDLHSLGSEQLGRGPYPDDTFSSSPSPTARSSMRRSSCHPGPTASTRRCGGPSRSG